MRFEKQEEYWMLHIYSVNQQRNRGESALTSICVRELDELKPDIQQYFDSLLFVCSE